MMDCCSEDLQKDPEEEELLKQLHSLTVRRKNISVLRKNLHSLRQDKGEPVRKFSGGIRALARVCDYKVSCECTCSPTYEESMIKDQVIAGLYNQEIQKDLISHEECETFSLEKMLKFLEGKESGEQDASVMASA